MSYKTDYTKVNNRIQKYAKKGKDGLFEYYELIDEIISAGQYSLLMDIFINEYNISANDFKSISILKTKSFDLIRKTTVSSFQSEYKKLLDTNNVYSNGFHFYDGTNHHYLGDIREIEEPQDWIAYKDPKLTEKQDEIRIINLEVTTGLSQSILEAVPPFETDVKETIRHRVGNHIIYTDNIYECIQSYTWSYTNQITPTYSSYWTQVLAPTYSVTYFSDDTIKLIDKYKLAVSLVKTFTYREV